ncbi:hypothetical protein [uncultured Maribacter sp.]|uniref:hypothetical protein n=1 Tax=uncultured Maribacter sp. TaxID=431308 RepID=UPI002638493F|nr:hypothetical protein [uncultured Maribacter sp.]
MKKVYLFLSLILPYLIYSQVSGPEIFAEYGAFYNGDLKSFTNHKITAGSELFSFKYLSPEIEIAYNFGTHEKSEIPFTSIAFGFSPKLVFQEEKSRWVFIPKYHFGNITAENFDSNNNAIKHKDKINFWSFAIGLEIKSNYNSSNREKWGVYLIYNGFNAKPTMSRVNVEQLKINNTQSIGLSFRISSNFKRKNEEYRE